MAVALERGVHVLTAIVIEALKIHPDAAHHDDKAFADESIYHTPKIRF
jgi:hypothetical protein